MNKMVKVEYNTERVLTTEQLAQAYECDVKRISENFKRNKSRFDVGKHYYKLEGDALKSFKATNPQFAEQFKHTPCLYLWTRRGASRHSKMLGTDRAWEMYDMLEENYFNPRPKTLSPSEQMAYGLIAAQKLLAEKDAKIKEMLPKAEFYDTVASTESLLSMADTAKVLDMGIGRNKLFKFLRNKQILDSYNRPYQRYVDAGYFKLSEDKYMVGDNCVVSTTTLVKQKGVDYIRKLLKKENIA